MREVIIIAYIRRLLNGYLNTTNYIHIWVDIFIALASPGYTHIG